EVARRFDKGGPPASAAQLAEQLQVPLRLASQLLARLAQSGLVVEVVGAESTYVPGRPLDHITVWQVFQALRVGQGQELATCDDPARQVVSKEFEAVEETWRQAAESRTLSDLVGMIQVTKPA